MKAQSFDISWRTATYQLIKIDFLYRSNGIFLPSPSTSTPHENAELFGPTRLSIGQHFSSLILYQALKMALYLHDT